MFLGLPLQNTRTFWWTFTTFLPLVKVLAAMIGASPKHLKEDGAVIQAQAVFHENVGCKADEIPVCPLLIPNIADNKHRKTIVFKLPARYGDDLPVCINEIFIGHIGKVVRAVAVLLKVVIGRVSQYKVRRPVWDVLACVSAVITHPPGRNAELVPDVGVCPAPYMHFEARF